MQKTVFKAISMLIVLAGFFVTSALAQEIYTPQRGDPLRKQLLDTIRPRVQMEMRCKVKFVVNMMNVRGKWAFLAVTPQKTNGRKINIRKTMFASRADMMDGLTNYSLLERANGRWSEVRYVVGPTEVAYDIWPTEYGVPRRLMGLN